jgi:uncharacterized membrane protein YphA (DoxX/SURF4 family)
MLTLPGRLTANRAGRTATIGPALVTRLRLATEVVGRYAVTLLRVSFGVIFIWFGALKIANATPVGKLVADTLPIVPGDFLVRALGVFEVSIGVGLLVGRFLALIAFLMVAHLTTTFLVLVTQPEVAFSHGNPLELTMTGEFVVKNIVLITAGLVLATTKRIRLSVDSPPEIETLAVTHGEPDSVIP